MSVLACLRDYGWRETAARTLHRFRVLSVVHSLDFFVRELNAADFTQEAEIRIGGRDFEFAEIPEPHFGAIRFAEGMQEISWMREQFAKGSRMFGAFSGGKLVADSWIHTEFAELDHIKNPKAPLAEGVYYSHGLLSSPEIRGTGVGSALCSFVKSQMAREGYRFKLAAVFLENHLAKKFQLKTGASYWGRITYVKRGQDERLLKYMTRAGRAFPRLFFAGSVDSSAREYAGALK